MIPKKIHYCWFGGSETSAFIKKCMATWSEFFPEFEIVLWDEKRLNLESVPLFVKQAYEQKKWAFVADYMRFYALYTEGGLYLDTDVEILRAFPQDWFYYDFFSSHEVHPGNIIPGELNENFLPINNEVRVHGISILSAIMGAQKGHTLIKDCLEQYSEMKFLDQNGQISDVDEIIIGQVLNRSALKYGYRFEDVEMNIDQNMLILPSNVLVGNTFNLNENSYAVHLINGSWTKKNLWERILYRTRNNHHFTFTVLNFINKVRLRIFRELKKLFNTRGG